MIQAPFAADNPFAVAGYNAHDLVSDENWDDWSGLDDELLEADSDPEAPESDPASNDA